MTKPRQVPVIETITGAFHAANCDDPDSCPGNCPGRMTTHQAIAVRDAVRVRIEEILNNA